MCDGRQGERNGDGNGREKYAFQNNKARDPRRSQSEGGKQSELSNPLDNGHQEGVGDTERRDEEDDQPNDVTGSAVHSDEAVARQRRSRT